MFLATQPINSCRLDSLLTRRDEQRIHRCFDSTSVAAHGNVNRFLAAVINDSSIDPQWRPIIRYALETNDPWLADIVRRAEAGETIIDSIDFSLDPETESAAR